jgi:hypothetical protein
LIDIAQIREQVSRYLANQQSLSDFNAWLIAETWNLSPEDASGVRSLFGSIELTIAEYDAGHLTIEDLRNKLGALASSPQVPLSVSSD